MFEKGGIKMSSTLKITTTRKIQSHTKCDISEFSQCSYCTDRPVVKLVFSFGMIYFCFDHFLPFIPKKHFGEAGLLCEMGFNMVDVTPVLGSEHE